MFLEPVRCGAEYEFTPCFFLGLGVLVFLDFQKATFEVLKGQGQLVKVF